jgi:hypothetical protein
VAEHDDIAMIRRSLRASLPWDLRASVARLPALFDRYKRLFKKQVEITVAIADVEREILAIETARPAPAPTIESKPTAKPKSKPQLAPVTREMATVTLAAIRTAGSGEPVLRRVIAKQLGIGDYACAYRLKRLQAIGFVERVGSTHYRVAKEVPAL